jgi:phosphonopyruvate decarboxylase
MSKLNPNNFFNYLKNKGIQFYTGVPDSLLKELNNVILLNTESKDHIITANEGSAIGVATGYHFATKKIPMVYLQNSGTGNIINPLMSLAHKDVYSIPMLIVIGWRGEPGVKDEPQHIAQGSCMIDLINSLNVTYDILPNNENEANEVLDKALGLIKEESRPHILLVKKNTFEKCTEKVSIVNNYHIYRKEAIEKLIKFFNKDIILSTTGKISRELLESADEIGMNHDNIFLNVGAMGHVSMISLGIALNTNKKVLCVDGDGSVIMHMGNLTSIGTIKCNNLVHVVLNNGMHESVGIQPTTAFDVNLSKVAESCGYSYCKQVSNLEDLEKELNFISESNFEKAVFLEVLINNKVNYTHELSRPKKSPIERKDKFINFINE